MDVKHLRDLANAYAHARAAVVDAGFTWEIRWQESRNFASVTESLFLREAAWVILASGMSDRVVRAKFPPISAAFRNWLSSKEIVASAPECRRKALNIFAHRGKIDAICTVAGRIAKEGFKSVKQAIAEDPIRQLQSFPFLGPATSYHLAKNLGLDVAKPDRHLLRIANAAEVPSPHELCASLSGFVGDRVSVIDIVLWRYATLESKYVDHFRVKRGSSVKRNLRRIAA